MRLRDKKTFSILLIAGSALVVAAPTRADTSPPAPTPAPAAAPADWSRGAFYGKVVDSTGKVVPGATVALQDKGGKTIAWTTTDAQGQYAIPVDCLKTLQLRPSRRRGLLASMAHGLGQVVTVPVKAAVAGVTTAVKAVNPVGTVKATVVSVATGSPAPVLSQLASATATSTADNSQHRARENAARAMMGERLIQPAAKKDELIPGEVFVAVSAPNFKAVKGKAGAYWLEQPPQPTEKDAKPLGTRAWLETIKLAPATAAPDKNSEIVRMAVLLGEAHMDPGLAPAGATLKISTKLLTPDNMPLVARVFARETKTKTVVELKPQGGNVFAGELPLDPKIPLGETTVAIVALRAEPIEVNLKESKTDPLLEFARQLDELDAGKAYDFDPRIMASENRLDLKLTVLDPKQSSPPLPAAAPAAPPPVPKL